LLKEINLFLAYLLNYSIKYNISTFAVTVIVEVEKRINLGSKQRGNIVKECFFALEALCNTDNIKNLLDSLVDKV
jgi:hypothetical protein